MTKIIGFGHRKQVGKDLLGSLLTKKLAEETSLWVLKTSFAHKLYDVCHQLYSWAGFKTKEYYDMHGEEKEIVLDKLGKSPRQILLDFGTNAVRRHVFSSTWPDYLLKNKFSCDVMFITDLRFPDEFKAIREHGGICIRIDRPSIPKSDDVADVALAQELNWNGVLINNGTPEDLVNNAYPLIWRYIFNESI